VSTHWRGATLDRFDGREWRPASNMRPLSEKWRRSGLDFTRGKRETTARVEVFLADPTAPRLFVPLAAKRVRMTEWTRGVRVHPLPDGNLRCVRTARSRRPLRYSVELHNGWRDRGGAVQPMTRRNRLHIYVPYDAVPQRVRTLARELRRQLASDADQHLIVEHMRAYLARRYRYLQPGAAGGARDLEEFMAGDAGAHCEYFATALALMLRFERIPCRVVTGYRSVEWDEDGTSLTVRARHAHAWVEVYDPKAGWHTVDPTPAQGEDAATAQGVWAQLRVRATAFWTRITGFNESSRGGVWSWVAALPGRLKDWVAAHPRDTALLFAGLVALLAGLRLRRRRSVPAVLRIYHAAVRKAGVAPESGETPRELLERVRARDLPAVRMRRLEEATTAHERDRYAVRA
ncbi:MAG: DUF3488 and transglutaminase-like domain-containing protein, partial [Planctomycetota bacterium]|nr:DUF3488 and transglutaminase-like domain-containing protein [Planctomycetota bacterium]